MNKPVAFVCGCISAVGLLILGTSLYYSIVYGHGSMDAGVFTRHVYWTKHDPATGAIERDHAELPTAEVTLLAAVDTWFAGTVFLVGGIAIYVFECTYRDKNRAAY